MNKKKRMWREARVTFQRHVQEEEDVEETKTKEKNKKKRCREFGDEC